MKTLLTAILMALSLSVQAVQAEDCQVRELGRISVFDPAGVGEWIDSAIIQYAFGVDFYGESRICNVPGGNAIESIEYEANLLFIDGDTVQRFEIFDTADALGFTQNGALYDVRSRYIDVGDYQIRFIRRAPEHQLVEVNGEEHVVPNYDQATIFVLEHDGLIWELDFRGKE